MPRDVESPYPVNAVFGVHKGFKTGVFTEYRDFLAQTADYPGGKELWAVFTNPQHAREYVSTGRCPVPPIAQHPTAETVSIPEGSARSLPTPDTSPETDAQPPSLPTRQRPSASAPLTASASQPQVSRKPIRPDPDAEGDTEPEDDPKLPSSSLPAAGGPLKKTTSRPPGWITNKLKLHASVSEASASGTAPRAKTPPVENALSSPPKPALPKAPIASSSRPSRPSHHSRPAASGSGPQAASSAPVSAPVPAPVPVPVPNLVPEIPRQFRPHGTYEQCHHCDGKGWITTPAQPPDHFPLPQPPVAQTPSRPRAAPTTNLRILSAASDGDSSNPSATNKTRTPSGSRLRVSSIGGVGPERTPRRDAKRSVSDTVAARRSRIVSDGAKDKGKGKGRAIEPMDFEATSSEPGPSTYNYM